MIIHTVKPGDNLTKIAKKYGTSVSALVSYNRIKNPSLILDGQKIKIPETAPAKKEPSEIRDLSELVQKVVEDVENLESFRELVRRL